MRSTNGTRQRGPIPSKTLMTVATALLAAAALVALARPAAADDPEATVRTLNGANDALQYCETPQRVGVRGAFGAWGHYVDGCTVRLTCPSHLSTCRADGLSLIRTQRFLGHKVTLNSRIRAFLAGGTEIHHRDVSCAGDNECRAEHLLFVRGGQHVSVQCNGVRESARRANTARVTCSLRLTNQ